MLDFKEHCDDTLPTELCGVKFQNGWHYLVDKKALEPYILEDERDTDYKSIVIYLDCEEYTHIGDVVYEAIFFTDIKHVGISGRICTVRKDLKDKAAAREEFLRKLQETLPKLNLKVDIDDLIKHRDELLNAIKNISIELDEINSELKRNI
jgi:hypothetical protein